MTENSVDSIETTAEDSPCLPEAQVAIEITQEWAKAVESQTQCDVYLFGSSIYKGGEQFDPQKSDLDIACVFPNEADALSRVNLMSKLRDLKLDLELKIVPALRRVSCTEPGVSIVALTNNELRANVHKSGVRNFWVRNYFYDFSAKRARLLEKAGTQYIFDEARHAMEYVQKIRNEYLSIAANNTGGLAQYSGTDPMPKALLRMAAQLNLEAQDGEWYDTMLGLGLLQSRLHEFRSQGGLFRELADCVSVRCGARGHERPLTADEQLLLGEVLFDEALKLEVEEAVTFHIKLESPTYSRENVGDFFRKLARFAPGIRLTGHRPGEGIILQVSAPQSTRELLEELQKQGALHIMLGVESASVIEHLEPAQEKQSRKDILSSFIKELKDDIPYGVPFTENQFIRYLKEKVSSDTRLKGCQFFQNLPVDNIPSFKLDLLISWCNADNTYERIGVEVMSARSSAALFDTLGKFSVLGQPVILVVLGGEQLVEEVGIDLKRYSEINSNIEVIGVF